MKSWVLKTTNGHYLSNVNGRYVEVDNLDMAARWSKEERALAVLNSNSVSPEMRPLFFAERLPRDAESAEVPEELGFEYPTITIKSAQAPSVKAAQKYTDKIDEVYRFFSQIPDTKAILKKEQKRIERAICDIQHYIELGNLGASDGYKAYKLLQSYLLQRREMKDKIALLEAFGNAINSSGLAEAKKAAESLVTRTYRPRELPDLFERYTQQEE